MAARNNPVGTDSPELVITRVFDAPRALVYKAWTEPAHIKHWSAPQGYKVTHADGDLRVGGRWRSCMRSPEGEDLWLGGVYREVIENERLVFTHAWDGPDGRPGHETLVTVQLDDEGDKTRMTFRHALFDSEKERDGHLGGWNQCFDQLGVYLAATR